jgi:hypothetical protein
VPQAVRDEVAKRRVSAALVVQTGRMTSATLFRRPRESVMRIALVRALVKSRIYDTCAQFTSTERAVAGLDYERNMG